MLQGNQADVLFIQVSKSGVSGAQFQVSEIRVWGNIQYHYIASIVSESKYYNTKMVGVSKLGMGFGIEVSIGNGFGRSSKNLGKCFGALKVGQYYGIAFFSEAKTLFWLPGGGLKGFSE